MTDTPQTLYPARYYAAYDTKSSQPAPVRGWFDCWAIGSLDLVPPASDMLALTEEQWASHYEGSWGVKEGALAPYIAPAPVVPLKTQAASALQAARMAVYNNYGIIGEPTPDDWITYLKALMAIESGTDTTSTTLPTAPTQ